MAEAAAKKLAGKYDSPEAMEKAYLELEAKLGTQGTELGEMKKLVAQYQPWVEKAIPVVDWYASHADKVNAWIGKGMPVEAQPVAQPAVAAADAQARAAAATTAGYEWLTPQEKTNLVGDIRQLILTETLKPWTESFAAQAAKFATDLQARFENQHKSFTEVMWQTLSRVAPKEKMDDARAWHEAALRFADPSKIDPMKLGDEFIELTGSKARLEARVKELEEQRSTLEKAAVPSFFGSLSPDTVADNNIAPSTTADERFKRVMTTVQNEHGPEGVRTMFPSLV